MHSLKLNQENALAIKIEKYQNVAIKPSSFYDDIVLKKGFACSKSLHVERFNDYVITLK